MMSHPVKDYMTIFTCRIQAKARLYKREVHVAIHSWECKGCSQKNTGLHSRKLHRQPAPHPHPPNQLLEC